MHHETGHYYTLGHLSQITGLTDRTLRTYLKNGILEGEKISGIWHFTESQLDAFLRHPTVRPSIQAKNNAIVYDFMLDTKKPAPRACVILDIPDLNTQAASRFFCDAICYGDYHDLRFSLDAVESPRIILSGPVEQILSLVNSYNSTH